MAAQTGHIHPAGTSLQYGTGTPLVIGNASIALTDIIDIELPSSKRSESNDTTLASPGAVLQSSSGWAKPGTGKVTLYLMEAQHAALATLHKSQATLAWLETFPVAPGHTVAATHACFAYITEMKISKAEQGSDQKFQVEYEIQMSGDDSFSVGS